MSYLLIDDNGEHSLVAEQPENSDFLKAVIKLQGWTLSNGNVDIEVSLLSEDGEFEAIDEEREIEETVQPIVVKTTEALPFLARSFLDKIEE